MNIGARWVVCIAVGLGACEYNAAPRASLEVGEGNRITAGEPIRVRFSEPVCPASLEVRVWSGRKDLYDIEGERVRWDRPILPDCTLRNTPCRSIPDRDDHDPFVNPRTREVCGNGMDDNSDGTTDEPDCEVCYFLDEDRDGYGVSSETAPCRAAPDGLFTAIRAGDCNDHDPDVHPGAAEVCDSLDNDCNGIRDDAGAAGCTTYFFDADADGWGGDAEPQCRCSAGSGYVARAGDCDDRDPTVHPEADEVCNGRDDDCDGHTDRNNCKPCTAFFRDVDADGFGVSADAKCLDAPEPPYTARAGGDCDDEDPAVHPAAAEVCNGRDDDCDGRTDRGEGLPGCLWFFRDDDQDGFGTNESRCLCGPESPFTVGAVELTLEDGGTLAVLHAQPGAFGPLAQPLVLEIDRGLADRSGHAAGYPQRFDFQVVERREGSVSCREDDPALPPYDVVQGAFLFFAHFASPPSPIELNQQFFCDIRANGRTGRFVMLCIDADPLPGAPLNTQDPAELKMDHGPEGFIFSVTGCLGADQSHGYVFESEPFTLALTIGPITFALRDTVLSGRITADASTGLAKWDGTMAVSELYMNVAGQETVYPSNQANFQLSQIPAALIPDGMPTACDADPCTAVGGTCDLLPAWPPASVCETSTKPAGLYRPISRSRS